MFFLSAVVVSHWFLLAFTRTKEGPLVHVLRKIFHQFLKSRMMLRVGDLEILELVQQIFGL
jgi:hypothetical protein